MSMPCVIKLYESFLSIDLTNRSLFGVACVRPASPTGPPSRSLCVIYQEAEALIGTPVQEFMLIQDINTAQIK